MIDDYRTAAPLARLTSTGAVEDLVPASVTGKAAKRLLQQSGKITMSHIVRGILGALAITGTLGVAQLAVGEDLGRANLIRQASIAPAVQDVNRSSKADRAVTPLATQPGQTFAVNLIGQSVLVRIPEEQISGALRLPDTKRPMLAPKPIVACEPVVSVLTEVAKQLQPGRCVA
ncbi:MAG: hypothetical protein QM576_00420 [Rhodopseudomonas sp.]|uniref:hypothetical protein n=1 Tax=Rhodopseudomonas sp. TaxID=1078 RepID=UPI0039E288A6